MNKLKTIVFRITLAVVLLSAAIFVARITHIPAILCAYIAGFCWIRIIA